MLLNTGKVAFQLLFILVSYWSTVTCPLILYNTDQSFEFNALEYDCLNYYFYRETLAYQELPDIVNDLIPYCIRPENSFNQSLETFINPLSQNLSFEQIRIANITAQQLLSWSVPVEVVERYQHYLNKGNALLNEHFYNCTPGWFGVRCQYSFDIGEEISFERFVTASFRSRTAYGKSSQMMAETTCYVLLQCHRHRQVWCLDWREVCDGKVDCFDERLDEEYCFDLELNECNDDEYRCQNGLCISRDLWEDGVGDTECLDRSDAVIDSFEIGSCFQDPTFRCEEHACSPNFKPYPCGDGECVLTFEQCHNGRHTLLVNSITAKGNLTEECRNAMVCYTRLIMESDESLCENWHGDEIDHATLRPCGSFFQFPTIPVYSDHVRFIYENPHLTSNDSEFLLPDYVCYDQNLCDFITPERYYENFACVKKPEDISTSAFNKNPWLALLSSTEQYFRPCLFSYATVYNTNNFNNDSLLYKCQNSSKVISAHRIMNGIQDCFENDDEEYQNSCDLNDQYRVTCHDPTKCWSPIVKYHVCEYNLFYEPIEIPFQSFCDGINRTFYDDHGKNYSDEFGCSDWLCNNLYTRCDGFWTCSDGRDEENCSPTICSFQTYACLDPENYTVVCLPSTKVNDGIDDCLGALDEQSDCRIVFPSKENPNRFRCSKYGECLQVSQLCDGNYDCEDDDDEQFCKNQTLACNQDPTHNRTNIEHIFCGLNEVEDHSIKYFSVFTSSNYPSLQQSLVTEFNHWPTQRFSIPNDNITQFENKLWPWYCNRGLAVMTQMNNDSTNLSCLCPPSYYGHHCQYQNQRTSLTLRLSSNDRHATYAIIIMLINNDDGKEGIDAYDQSVYVAKQSCTIKLNRYLLFSTRPKNISSSYDVRIDVYEKNVLTYVGTWHFPISFLFLPVNRLGISLNLSNHLIQLSSNCSISCEHGECIKYVNNNESFCRCFPGWSGNHCNTSINCSACSSDSICIGSTSNRPICVCPIDKFGPRCLLTSTCPINTCQNNGQCIPGDITNPQNKYTCICTDRFFGTNCQYRKATLDVSFQGVSIPSYLIAYFFTLSNNSDPIETIILRKLTLFQDTVTFHVPIPYQLTFIQSDYKYYLAVLQQSPKTSISTTISSKQECTPIDRLLDSTILNMIPYRRIIHFHLLCQKHHDLNCFIDETYLCLCTNEHHANCMKFNNKRNFQCPLNTYCQNHGYCLQDHPTCPSTKICLCPNCYFGNQCEFYAKGLGSTLDEILGYEFKHNTLTSKQSVTIIMAGIITMIIFLIGISNSILSILIFIRKKSQEVGCGLYLLSSSITSLITIFLFTFKFWLLFFSYQYAYGQSHQQYIFQANCYIEPLLKGFLYIDNWLNACVAIERTICVSQGITFNKIRSKIIAKRLIIFIFICILCLFIPQVIHFHIYNDDMEEKSWCVVRYTTWLQTYSNVLLFVHYFLPLAINILSIFCIIILTTYQRSLVKKNHTYWFHLKTRIKHYGHILISSFIIICLTLPHLIISVILDCQKSSNLLWFYLVGYFLSFLPAAFVFVIYVIPSPHYIKEYYELKLEFQTRLQLFRASADRL